MTAPGPQPQSKGHDSFLVPTTIICDPRTRGTGTCSLCERDDVMLAYQEVLQGLGARAALCHTTESSEAHGRVASLCHHAT
eukprot:1150166-Pelagomonas_calceolata.AAC.3